MSNRADEFQAVILCCSDEGLTLYPIDIGISKALVPIANIPLLSYQLNLLKNASFTECLVVVLEHEKQLIEAMLTATYSNSEFNITIISVSEDVASSTSRTLHSIRAHLIPTADLFLFKGDLVTDASLHDIADLHRTKKCSLTMVLKELDPASSHDERKRLAKEMTAGGIARYFAFEPSGAASRGKQKYQEKLLFLKSLAEDESFHVSRALLKQHPQINLRTDLKDPNIYVFSPWVVKHLIRLIDEENSRFTNSSLQTDFIPYLLSLQFDLQTAIPEIKHTKNITAELSPVSPASWDQPSEEEGRTSGDVRCYAHIIPANGSFVKTLSTVADYLSLNKEVMGLPTHSKAPWDRFVVSKEKQSKGSLVAESAVLHETSTVKGSVIGADCVIEEGCKIVSSVLMDKVTIEAGSLIQNSIICKSAAVGTRSQIQESQVCASVAVPEKTMLKKDSFLPDYDEELRF